MRTLAVRVLGGYEVIDSTGRQIRFHTRKAAALLAYLAVSPGKEFSRDHLMNLLWSDRAEAQASNSLRQALSQLRKAVNREGLTPLLVSAESVSVDPGAVSTDAVEFERIAGGKDPTYHDVVQLYRGDFLADFTVRDNAFEEWRRQKAARIRSIAIDTFDVLLTKFVTGAESDSAIELAHSLLSIDPAHENAHRALMKIHNLKGRRGAALQQYEFCREILFRELGVEPEAETEELRRAIQSGKHRSTVLASIEPKNTLAVLPFTTTGDDLDARKLSNGLAASIAMELGRFRSLSVVSTASSLSFEDSDMDLHDIAESLDARYLVEGSVERIGIRLIGSMRLTEPRSGRQVWSDHFDAVAQDIFDVEGRIVQSIVAPLAARIEDDEISAARRKPVASLDTYDHWLRGLSHLRIMTADAEKVAQDHFLSAIDLDPQFARAHAGLAMAYFNTWSCGAYGSWHDDMERCLTAAKRAFTLDPSDHWPHMVLAGTHLFQREFDKSKAHYDRAIALNPNDANLLAYGSLYLTYYGEHAAAVEAGLAALRLNPFYTDIYPSVIALGFQMARRYDEALELRNQISEPIADSVSWDIALHVELGNLDHARRLTAKFHRDMNGLWPGVSSNDDLREILETINPWKRQEDHDRFFSALEEAGVFDDQYMTEEFSRSSTVR